MTAELVKLEQAARMLAEIKTVPEAANEIDRAAAARVYAQKAKLGKEAEDSALAIRMLAERRMGQLVQEGQEAGQIAERGDRVSNIPNGNVSTLADLGVTAKQVHEAKLLAGLTDAEIVEQVKAAEKASRRKVLKEAAKRATAKSRPNPPPKPPPTRTPDEQAAYDFRHGLRDAFASACAMPHQCSHPNNIDRLFLAITEDPFNPVLNINPDRARSAAERLRYLADEWEKRTND